MVDDGAGDLGAMWVKISQDNKKVVFPVCHPDSGMAGQEKKSPGWTKKYSSCASAYT